MKKIGITGGIGAGKTLVCRIFEVLQVPVYNADTRARELMESDAAVKQGVTDLFGESAYNDGKLNRKLIASRVFGNDPLLEALDALVHPAVANDFEQWTVQHKNYGYVMKEAALLFETGSYKALDETILVVAPEELRTTRVQTRDGRNKDQVRAIMAKQMTDEEKVKLADHVIVNDGVQLVLPQVLKIHAQIP